MKFNFLRKRKEILLISFTFLFFIFSLVGAVDISQDNQLNDITGVNIIIPEASINYSLIPTVNSSEFWDNLDSPADINVGDLGDGDEYAKYQFLNNNFNGSGNFTTTGNIRIGTFNITPDGNLSNDGSDIYIKASVDLGFGIMKALNVRLLDIENPTYGLKLQTENTGISADRILFFDVGDTDKRIILSGTPVTLDNWFDQSVKTTASPNFVNITATGTGFIGEGLTTNNLTLKGEGDVIGTSLGGSVRWYMNEEIISGYTFTNWNNQFVWSNVSQKNSIDIGLLFIDFDTGRISSKGDASFANDAFDIDASGSITDVGNITSDGIGIFGEGLTINANKVNQNPLILQGKGLVIPPTGRGGSIQFHYGGDGAGAIGYVFGNVDNRFVWKKTPQTSVNDVGVAYVDFDNGNMWSGDNAKRYFGTGRDASIYYNASDLIIDSAEVGSGQTRFMENTTFEKDVIIDGTLFGGSPVKIAGINITNNLFMLEENLNSSSRFTLKNLNEGSNATAIISAINDVGGAMSIGIGSSNFMIGDTNYKNITALFSKSRGDMVFANFFNQKFTWLYNPSDDGDANNLVELMRINGSGLNVSGNITSENIFLPQYIFSHDNETMPLIGASTWTNLTFSQEEAKIKQGISHTHNDNTNITFLINEDGIYNLDYNFDVIDTSASSTDIDVAGRVIYSNGTEIDGSVFETDITKKDIETEISHDFLADLRAGDKIVFQFIAEDADVEISTHGTFGDHPESASIVIEKIANIP